LPRARCAARDRPYGSPGDVGGLNGAAFPDFHPDIPTDRQTPIRDDSGSAMRARQGPQNRAFAGH